jgi:hypothetical protein
VTVNLEHAMLVIAVAAPGRLRASVPVQSALSAGHGTADLDHGTTIAANCPDDPLESKWDAAISRMMASAPLTIRIDLDSAP